MQRRLIARPPQANGGANHQREQPDTSEHEVQRTALRHGHQRDFERLARAQPQQRVGQAGSFAAAMLEFDHVGGRLDG